MNIPIWALSPALMLFSAFFFAIDHMNYNLTSWFVGNGLIMLGIGIFYLGNHVNKKWYPSDKE